MSHNPVPARDPSSPALPTDPIEHDAFQRVEDLLSSNEIEQPSSPPPPMNVEISSPWPVSLEGTKEPLTRANTRRLGNDSLYHSFMEWMREESVHLEDPPDGQVYGIRRIYGKASYERLPKPQYMTSSIKNEI
jgi:hypothetical protein